MIFFFFNKVLLSKRRYYFTEALFIYGTLYCTIFLLLMNFKSLGKLIEKRYAKTVNHKDAGMISSKPVPKSQIPGSQEIICR